MFTVIFGRPGCPYCVRAKELAEKLTNERDDFNYRYVDIHAEGISKADLEKTIENRHLEDEILEVRVPMQEVVEMKNGAKKTVQKKLFPGYVLVNMIMNDDTWYVVRNTRGVTGFVGPGSKPVPLSEAEMKPLGFKSDNVSIDFTEGDTIVVVAGAWKDTVGAVYKIDYNKQTVTINVELFGRDTPVEISFSEVRKLD